MEYRTTTVKSLASVEKRDNNCNSSSSSALSAQKEVKSLDTAEVQQNLFQCRKLKDYLKCFITVTTKENRHFMRMFQDTSETLNFWHKLIEGPDAPQHTS